MTYFPAGSKGEMRFGGDVFVSECGQQQEEGLLIPGLPVRAGIPLHALSVGRMRVYGFV